MGGSESKTSSSNDDIVTYEYVVDQNFPPVLIVDIPKDGTLSSPLPVSTKTTWIDSVNSTALKLVSACEEGEKKVENILDRALNGQLDRQEASHLIDFILLEIGTQMVSDVMQMKNVCLGEMTHMTNAQRKQVLSYSLHMAEFCMELCIWAKKIINKIIDEAFQGKTMERNITSKFFHGFMQAFQKANLTELISSHHHI